MKTITSKIVLFTAKYGTKARLVTFILTLAMFILAAGAPDATGSVGR